MNFEFGIIEFFKESWQTDFSDKSILMLGKLTVYGPTKYDIFSVAKKFNVNLDYKLLKSSTVNGGG